MEIVIGTVKREWIGAKVQFPAIVRSAGSCTLAKPVPAGTAAVREAGRHVPRLRGHVESPPCGMSRPFSAFSKPLGRTGNPRHRTCPRKRGTWRPAAQRRKRHSPSDVGNASGAICPAVRTMLPSWDRVGPLPEPPAEVLPASLRIKEPSSMLHRRRFLATTAAAAFSFHLVPRSVLGGPGRKAPSEKLNIAGIGVGGQGGRNLAEMAGENIVALCDVDSTRRRGQLEDVSQGGGLSRLPRDAREAQGHRRGDDRHARPHARADHAGGAPLGQARLRGKADGAQHRRGAGHGPGRPKRRAWRRKWATRATAAKGCD